MSERAENPEHDRPTAEEGLLRDSINDAFQNHADIMGIAHLTTRKGHTAAVTILAGLVDNSVDSPQIQITRLIAKGNINDVITFLLDPSDQRTSAVYSMQEGGCLIVIAKGLPRADPDTVDALHDCIRQAEWDEHLSRRRAEHLDKGMILPA